MTSDLLVPRFAIARRAATLHRYRADDFTAQYCHRYCESLRALTRRIPRPFVAPPIGVSGQTHSLSLHEQAGVESEEIPCRIASGRQGTRPLINELPVVRAGLREDLCSVSRHVVNQRLKGCAARGESPSNWLGGDRMELAINCTRSMQS